MQKGTKERTLKQNQLQNFQNERKKDTESRKERWKKITKTEREKIDRKKRNIEGSTLYPSGHR